MLCLKVTSQPQWINEAKNNLKQVLIDHAHSEKKAAMNAITLLNRYPERNNMVEKMLALAQEELVHFSSVMYYIKKFRFTLVRDDGDLYAQKLHGLIRKLEPFRLLDSLLVAALIEARSCERFSILSKAVEDNELKLFYKSLLASEAGHYLTFYDMACEYFNENEVKCRFDWMCNREAKIILELGSDPTIHG